MCTGEWTLIKLAALIIDTNCVNHFIILQFIINKIADKIKPIKTKIKRTMIGWHNLLRTLVAGGDHPQRVSHHLCLASFLTLSITQCIFLTLWWRVTRVFCLFFLIFSKISIKSWWSNSRFTKVTFIPKGVGNNLWITV